MANPIKNNPQLTHRLWLLIAVSVLFAMSAVCHVQLERRISRANHLHHQAFLLADELRQSSDDLTRISRIYVVTGNPLYKTYFQEILDIRDGKKPRPKGYQYGYWDIVMAEGKPRDIDGEEPAALLDLMRSARFGEAEFSQLREAKAQSDRLTATEFEAMQLAEPSGPNAEARRAKALKMLSDDHFHQAKASIMKPIAEFYRLMDRHTLAIVKPTEVWVNYIRLFLVVLGIAMAIIIWNIYSAWRSSIDRLEQERKRVEQALRDSQASYQDVMTSLPAGAYQIVANTSLNWHIHSDTITFFTFISARFCDLLGLSHDELMAKPSGLLQMIHPDDYASFIDANELARNTLQPFSWEGRMAIREQTRWMHFSSQPRQLSPHETLWTGVLMDVTDRKVTEETMRKSQQRYRLLAENTRDVIWVLDPSTMRFLYVSPSVKQLLGYTPEEMLTLTFTELLLPNIREEFLQRIQERVRHFAAHPTPGMSSRNQVLHLCKDGSTISTELVNNYYINAESQRVEIQGISRDITERKLVEDVLKFLAQSVGQVSGLGFFQSLAAYLAEKMSMDFVCIDRLQEDGLTAQTLAVWHDGQFEDNMTYALTDTPCGKVVGQSICYFPSEVCQLFPQDELLRKLRAESYVGVTLWSHARQPIGLIVLIARHPLVSRSLAEAVLKIVAVRAGAELERLETEHALRNSETLYRSLFDNMQHGFAYCRLLFTQGRANDFVFLSVNQAFEGLTGLQQVEGKRVSEAIPGIFESDPQLFKVLAGVSLSGESERSEIFLNSVQLWFAMSVYSPSPEHFVVLFDNITQRKEAEEEIRQLAFYDSLTALPNRRLLLDRLRQALVNSARSQHPGALLFIDLDNFKALNDSFGHDQGDRLLQQVASRLVSCVRESDTVARMGGDEFLVMLEDLSEMTQESAVQAEQVGNKILAALNQPHALDSLEYHGSTSIGVTVFQGQMLSVEELMKQADLALYQAKAMGRNMLRFFNPDMQSTLDVRSAMEKDLREGIKLDHFLLYFQPQVDAAYRMTGAEVLVRWQHPRHGLMPPGDFIALAEETGLIHPLGLWVLETACRLLAKWADQPKTADLTLAVNVSARQFRAADFVEQVVAVLAQTGINPMRLKFELTESLLLDNVEDTIDKMSALKKMGVAFSLDDFGIGYSSLSYLKRLPLDQLKIDLYFVRDVLTDQNDAAIIRTLVALGKTLGLAVIAEGVETESQRDLLAQLGCHSFQGYLFGRPMPAEELRLH